MEKTRVDLRKWEGRIAADKISFFQGPGVLYEKILPKNSSIVLGGNRLKGRENTFRGQNSNVKFFCPDALSGFFPKKFSKIFFLSSPPNDFKSFQNTQKVDGEKFFPKHNG